MKKLIVTAALTGTAGTKEQNYALPVTTQEIAEDVVRAVKAGAAIVHIHVKDEQQHGTMETAKFKETFDAIQEALKSEKLDAIVNLTTSGAYGGYAPGNQRLAHLELIKPEMCSFDAATMNWDCSIVFSNPPDFLEQLCECTLKNDVKPEIEIFDGGGIGNAKYYIEKGLLKAPCHFQFVLGVLGGLEGTTKNLQFLVDRLPEGSTWSVTGIGRAHIPMMLAGLSLGCDGIRVGLEDNLYLAPHVKATNEQLVKRAVELGKLAGREIATAEDAREMLGIKRKNF